MFGPPDLSHIAPDPTWLIPYPPKGHTLVRDSLVFACHALSQIHLSYLMPDDAKRIQHVLYELEKTHAFQNAATASNGSI